MLIYVSIVERCGALVLGYVHEMTARDQHQLTLLTFLTTRHRRRQLCNLQEPYHGSLCVFSKDLYPNSYISMWRMAYLMLTVCHIASK